MIFLGYAHWFISIRISQMKDHYIYVDKARYATSIVAYYLDTTKVKASKKFYKTASTSDEQVEKLSREFNFHYRSCIGSLIYLLSTRVDLSFAVNELENFSSNPNQVHCKGLVHLLRYIRDNKTLGLKYYSDMNNAPVSYLLRQAIIKTENQLLDFFDSSWQDWKTLAEV